MAKSLQRLWFLPFISEATSPWLIGKGHQLPCLNLCPGTITISTILIVQFEVVTATLEQADIDTKGLFLNADAGFDSKDFRKCFDSKEINANVCFNKRNGNADDRDEYFDQELFDLRYTIERTNAWMDSYRSLLNRFDTTIASWKGFNLLAFIVIALKKFKNKKLEKV